MLNDTNLLFSNLKDYELVPKEVKIELVKRIYTSGVLRRHSEPTYLHYQHFMRILFNIFDTFSKNPIISPDVLRRQSEDKLIENFKFE